MSTYKQLDQKTLIDFMSDMEFKKDNKRECVIHAGAEFHRQVEIKMERMVYKEVCKDLLDTGILSSEIHTNLLNMINSEDTENFQVAKSYIKNIQLCQ